MRVVIVSVGEPLPSDGENVRLRRMGNLADFLTKNNNEVDWYSVSFDHYKKTQRVDRDTIIELKPNYRLHLVRVNGYKRNISLARIVHHFIASKKILMELNRLDDKPDVLLASMEPLELSSISMKYSTKNNIPSVVDVRDLWPEIYYEVIPSKLHWLLNIYVNYCSVVLKKTMSSASSIVGLSKDFMNYGLKYAERKESVCDAIIPIAYPNYDYSSYVGNYSIIGKKYNVVKEDFLVVFFGNFGNQFNFGPIVDAANLLIEHKDIKFVLCGTGIQLDEVKNAVGNNVIFTEWIEKEEILSFSANASIGIAPYIDSKNYRMNTPNKFGEYLSASLPILVGVSGCMERLVEENKCGHQYNNGDELANYILEYYQNREELSKASRNARKLYEKMFDGDVVNQRFYEHLVEVAKIRR